MNESIAQRIKRIRGVAGISQAKLAEACGWSQSRVGNYEAGTREPSFADIESMAKALRVDKSELLMDMRAAPVGFDVGKSAPFKTAKVSSAEIVNQMLSKHGKNLTEDARKMIADAVKETAREVGAGNVITTDFSRPGQVGDEVWIAHYDVRAAMGGGQVPHDYPEMLQDVRVSPKHLREIGVEFKEHFHLKMVTGWGQSMAPTIKHRDPLLVDVTIREFMGDGIYLFSHEGLLYIKRLQKKGREHFMMISDNTNHQPEDIRVDETFIQARVLLVWNANLV